MPIDLRTLFHSNKPYSFRQELDGTNLSAVKLERVLSRRWNNKYAVEVVSPSPYHILYLIVTPDAIQQTYCMHTGHSF
jgi:hypothetical protein